VRRGEIGASRREARIKRRHYTVGSETGAPV
jgi:hypothetical protein